MTKPELETCMIKYGKDIYSFCRSLVGSIQEAEDLYQDTFLKAIELNEKIDAAGNPKSYLLSIAVRIWKNRKRKYAWRKRIADFKSYTEGQDVEADSAADCRNTAYTTGNCKKQDVSGKKSSAERIGGVL